MEFNVNERFISKDKQGNKYTYKFIGKVDNNECYNLELYNETTNSSTFVELEWFNQREITRL